MSINGDLQRIANTVEELAQVDPGVSAHINTAIRRIADALDTILEVGIPVVADGETITGDGTAESPLVAVGGSNPTAGGDKGFEVYEEQGTVSSGPTVTYSRALVPTFGNTYRFTVTNDEAVDVFAEDQQIAGIISYTDGTPAWRASIIFDANSGASIAINNDDKIEITDAGNIGHKLRLYLEILREES